MREHPNQLKGWKAPLPFRFRLTDTMWAVQNDGSLTASLLPWREAVTGEDTSVHSHTARGGMWFAFFFKTTSQVCQDIRGKCREIITTRKDLARIKRFHVCWVKCRNDVQWETNTMMTWTVCPCVSLMISTVLTSNISTYIFTHLLFKKSYEYEFSVVVFLVIFHFF